MTILVHLLRSFFLLLSLFLLLVSRCLGNVECLPDQRASLLELKTGFSTQNLTTWQPDTNCCSWEGITCDSESGRVVGLDLSSRLLSGSISSCLFNLTSLQTLNFAYSVFPDGQPIPQLGFEKLVNLTHLNLSYATLGRQIPVGISRLTRLITLDLSSYCSDRYLHDPNLKTLVGNLRHLRELHLNCVDISNDNNWSTTVSMSLPRLQVLSLRSCNLQGLLKNDILFGEKLARLKHLDLSYNKFRGMIPHTIGKLVRLEFLDLSGNNLGGMIPSSIVNLTQLIHLNLKSTGISGVIPSSIGQLAKLVRMDLSHNNLSGSLPSFVSWARINEPNLSKNNIGGSLPSSNKSVGFHHLRLLDLSFNSISGSIPAYIFCLPALHNLNLSYNQVSGIEGKFSCPSTPLWFIDLSHNQLQGTIPMSLFNFSGLQTLNIASNNFSGTMEIGSFENLIYLTNLDLSNNQWSVRDSHYNYTRSFPKFEYLKLASCNLTKLPAFLRFQDTISSLDLSNNRIGGDIPKWIWSIGNGSLTNLNLSCNLFTRLKGLTELYSTTSLNILDLHSNMLQGPIPLPPTRIYYLDYSDNNFSSIIPSNISSCNSIYYFSLANNGLTGEIPQSICKVSPSAVFDFSNNSLSGSIPSCLSELLILNLRGNRLQGIIPQFLQDCQLGTLILSDNDLEGQLPRSLVNCTDLQVLDLGNNHIEDAFPYWLGNIVTLRVLILKANEFYGPVELPESPEVNYSFPKLQIFDLSSNHFSGNLSSKCFHSLKVMMRSSKLNYSAYGLSCVILNRTNIYQDTISVRIKGQMYDLGNELPTSMFIDFSDNGFEGAIPEMIGELQGLHSLNFSHNALKGEIPSTIGNLKQLESLDLSKNLLSGLIPLELTSLTFLSFLNLSNNNLVGEIPQGNQLSTFANSSFQVNPGLCGRPLSKQCGNVPPNNTAGTSKSDHSSSNYVIGLALFIGLGFGVGIALVLVLQNVPLKFRKREVVAARY